MYFSLPVERKVPKERHAREAPKVPPLRNPPPTRATPSPIEGRRSLNARKVEDSRGPARTAERRPRGTRPKRGEERENFSHIPANRSVPRARRSAEVADCRRPVKYPRIKPFCRRAKRQRRTGDRIRKERTWVLSLRGDSFGTFLSPRKEKYIISSPRKLQFAVSLPHRLDKHPEIW